MAANSFASGQHQQGAKTLAAIEDSVAHGVTQASRRWACFGAGDPSRQSGINRVELLCRPSGQVESVHVR
jgi:hypothetical protein